MSDIDVLSHEYKTSSVLSTSLNSAIMAAKRLQYGLPGRETLTEEKIRSHQEHLLTFLVGLLRLMSARGEEERETEAKGHIIPGSLIEKIRSIKRTTLPYYLKDLEEAAAHLAKGFQHLTEEDINILDELCKMSDAETSSLFRRLWRK